MLEFGPLPTLSALAYNPDMEINIQQNNITLRPFTLSEAHLLYGLIDSNREHLGQWLGWVDSTRSIDDSKKHIKKEEEK
jgi:ribosomal-protein-serine acetyltransferase